MRASCENSHLRAIEVAALLFQIRGVTNKCTRCEKGAKVYDCKGSNLFVYGSNFITLHQRLKPGSTLIANHAVLA